MTRAPVVALALALLLSGAPRALACAPAPPRGGFVAIPEESAIVVWDAAAGTQHFVRRATFATGSEGFGFLVPTPAPPQLAEARDEAFAQLSEVTRPEVRYEERWVPAPVPLLAVPFLFFVGSRDAESGRTGAPRGVDVLDAVRVAGYDAAVLRADDPRALREWLETNGYDARPELADWLAHYVEARWVVTAFKVAAPNGAERVRTGAVRMSFRAERPFFPYREPADQRKESAPGGRVLRVYYVGDSRPQGTIEGGGAWPGRATWSGPLPDAELPRLAERIGLDAGRLPAGLRMTVFEDLSSPRPGTADLFFARADDQSTILPPPIVNTVSRAVWLPPDVILGAAGALVWWRRRRRRAASHAKET